MIFGIGVDIIEIFRIGAAVANDRFCRRVFTGAELSEGRLAPNRLAGFFAAKEAFLKALGTGLAGFAWRELEVGHDAQGAPQLQVSGKVAAYLAEKRVDRIHLSISHCREYAVAQVILEKELP
ncbi:MAG: holo-ACP synthase [Bacillota bacterium]|jgi:holo-[acyl-carrier protein] synthase